MTSYYSVIQYSPDPIAEEKVNIGVLTWDDSGARVKFVRDFRRARLLGMDGFSELRPFAEFVEQKTRACGDLVGGLAFPDYISNELIHWSSFIQLTPPRGSLENPCDLLARLVPRYIKETRTLRSRVRGRDRRAATSEAFSLFTAAVRELSAEKPVHQVRRQQEIEGRLNGHLFDVVLSNDTVAAALDTISFEVGTGPFLQKEVDSIAWAIDDVRSKRPDLPLAVYALKTSMTAERRKVFSRARKTYDGLNAVLIDSKGALRRWTSDRARFAEVEAA